MKQCDHNKIIDAFKNGAVENLEQKKGVLNHIETGISNVFLYEDRAYKMYKKEGAHINKYYNHIADPATRKEFYENDFLWNHYFSPDVYLELIGVDMVGPNVALVPKNETALDFVIKMKRINSDENLTSLLHKDVLKENDFQKMGFMMTKAIVKFPHKPKMTDIYYNNLKKRISDLRKWVLMAQLFIKKQELGKMVDLLDMYIEKNKSNFLSMQYDNLTISIDNHSDNVFYKNNKISFIDIYPPKHHWRLEHPTFNIHRAGTDILILKGEKYYNAFCKGYEDYYGTWPGEHRDFHVLRSGLIKMAYLFDLSKSDPSKKEDAWLYWNFLKENFGNL